MVDQTALDSEVARFVSRNGVESRTPTQALLVCKSRIGLFWNTILTLITAGIWLVIVAYRVINRKHNRIVLTLDELGRVHRA